MSRLECGISRRRFVRQTAFTAIGLSTMAPVAATRNEPNVTARSAGPGRRLIQVPMAGAFSLNTTCLKALASDKLGLREGRSPTPVQVIEQFTEGGSRFRLCWIGPESSDPTTLRPVKTSKSEPVMSARRNPSTGQIVISERDTSVLQYNYATVQPGDVLSSIAESNRKYAVPRSDYIHPLYGPHGEFLTKDWSKDHPHHRGIYWAWPEVDWRGERADLHALQTVFARPAGKCDLASGPVFAQVQAENLWKWKDREPIVREWATIRAFRATDTGRVIDLIFRFEAVAGPVLVARRGAAHYGGLNIRLNEVKGQQVSKHTDPETVSPRKAWSDLSGQIGGALQPAGVTVLQHSSNPAYPGDWIEYPDLNWLQPTFPAAGTRHEIAEGKPLVLRFRLLIHPGGPISEPTAAAHWCAANSINSPLS